ncbi:MAG: anion permease [Coriobacteriales bacterium]|jgi:anion transporter|nr:anion permease [Coriobacteriales bacterium]
MKGNAMKKYLPYIGSGVFLLLAAVIMIFKPFSPDLSDQGQMVIGGLLIAIGIWIFKPFNLPFSMGGMFLAFFLLVQKLPPAVVFAGFTQSALWTLIPALFFGFVLQKTGLGKRIALAIIKLFRPTYLSMIIAWFLIGVILSILTPSITVRVAILLPIAVYCCNLFGLEPGSKGNSLLLLTAFAVALVPGTGWLTGALSGPILMGMYNSVPGLEGLIDFSSWFSVAFIPMEIVTVILLFGGYLVLKPKEPLDKDAIAKLKAQKAEPMSRDEKAAGIILVASFTLFITNSLHGIPDAAVCMLALVCFFIFKIMNVSEFGTGISWDLVTFVGVALGLGAVFATTGVSTWLAEIVVPAIKPLASNPWIFMLVVTTILFAWRFIDIATLIPTMAIIVPILPAITQAYNISPLVWVPIFVMTVNAFFMAYQNMWALMSQSIAGEQTWTAKHLGTYGVVYFVACLIAICVAVPIYISMGLL